MPSSRPKRRADPESAAPYRTLIFTATRDLSERSQVNLQFYLCGMIRPWAAELSIQGDSS